MGYGYGVNGFNGSHFIKWSLHSMVGRNREFIFAWHRGGVMELDVALVALTQSALCIMKKKKETICHRAHRYVLDFLPVSK